ncbi:hypothetical protein K1T71_007822 [Dendrolimus kikuchii]|uniref:Uncharacterized protein n=1 Tax=Dendrolimus kikuchii TaxID=765133 RepID=A0ACC1CYA9_9NEOP|nr:hypothetical protein K1T71_007822 [Dendrolimus kikuchii]
MHVSRLTCPRHAGRAQRASVRAIYSDSSGVSPPGPATSSERLMTDNHRRRSGVRALAHIASSL